MSDFTRKDYEHQVLRAQQDLDLLRAEQPYDIGKGPIGVDYQHGIRLERAMQNFRIAEHELVSFLRRNKIKVVDCPDCRGIGSFCLKCGCNSHYCKCPDPDFTDCPECQGEGRIEVKDESL